jgi:hypothetical protein
MSLIQDALKRKSEEKINAPDNPPIAITEPQADGKSPQLLLIGLIILLVAGLLAALVGLSIYLIKPKEAVATKAVITVSEPEPDAVPEVPVQNIETALVSTVVEPAKEEPAPEIKPPAAWPELTLTGIARGDKSLAILNGKMLSAGRKLGDVTIIEVNDRNIVVEYSGERRILYIDE